MSLHIVVVPSEWLCSTAGTLSEQAGENSEAHRIRGCSAALDPGALARRRHDAAKLRDRKHTLHDAMHGSS